MDVECCARAEAFQALYVVELTGGSRPSGALERRRGYLKDMDEKFVNPT